MSVQTPLFDRTATKPSKIGAPVEKIVGDGFDVGKFVENFSVLVEAEGSFSRMRRLVLELAVRGRLVDPVLAPPKPVAEAQGNAGSKAARKARSRDVSLERVSSEEAPFSLPANWLWGRLNDTGEYINGLAFKPSDWGSSGYPIIRIQNLTDATKPIHRTQASFDDAYIVQTGDLLVSWSATLDVFLWDREPGVLNQHIFRVLPNLALVLPRFLYYALRYCIRDMEKGEHAHGLVMKHINRGPFLAHPVPVPPLAEQRRIVAKVDELMRLLDDLEAKQAKKRETQARLRTAALGALTSAEGPEEFGAAWKRVTENFGVLFERSGSVEELRAVILQLAVIGKLVAHDVGDAAQDGMSSAAGSGDDTRIKLPTAWRWVKLGQVGELINGDRSRSYPNRAEYVQEGVAWINTGHIEPDGTLSLGSMHYISRKKFDSLRSGKVRPGDLVYCLRGATLGKTAIITQFTEGAVASSLVIIRLSPVVDPAFAYRVLTSPLGREQIFRFDNGSAQPNLSANSVKKYSIPLPPLAEQRRIVAKVDQLMKLCDDLGAKLQRAETTAAKLVEAVVAEMVAA